MNRTYSINPFTYVDPNTNPNEHALWLLGEMHFFSRSSPPLSPRSCSDDEEVLKEVLLQPIDPKLIDLKFEYVKRTVCGICSCVPECDSDCDSVCECDSDCDCEVNPKTVYVPVTCSKNCNTCIGSSPGCGENYLFNEIDEIDYCLNLSAEDRANIRISSLKHHASRKNKKYITFCIKK